MSSSRATNPTVVGAALSLPAVIAMGGERQRGQEESEREREAVKKRRGKERGIHNYGS